MPQDEKVEASTTPNKAGKKSILPIVIGAFIVLFLLGTALSYGMKFFAKKAGTSLLEGMIESKTGVKTNLQDVESGKMEFTDSKTGQTVTVGGQELPATFPKDFPVYNGATVAGSVSGTQAESGNGFFVTFTTGDAFDTVVAFYKNGLTANGWTTTSSISAENVQTWTVKKGTQEGSVSVTTDSGETSIMVTLGENAGNE